MLAGLAAAIITARVLGVEGRGVYFYVVTMAFLAVQLANLGLPSSNAYFSARNRAVAPQLLSNSFWVSVVLGPVAVAVVLAMNAGVSAAPLRSTGEIAWAFLIAPCALFYLLSTNLLIGMQEFGRYNAISICSSLFQLGLLAILAIVWPSVGGFLAVFVLTSLLACAAAVREISKSQPTHATSKIDLMLLKQSMGLAARAFLVLLFGYLLSRMPVIALGLYGDARSVGLVSIVVQFLDALLILPSSVAMVLFPLLVSGQAKDRGARTLRATLWVVAIMIAVCGVLALISTPLIVLLFGEAFSESSAALRWALPGVVLLSAVNVFGQYLAAEGFPISTILAWAAATAAGYALAFGEPGADAARNTMRALSCAYAILTIGMAAIFASRLRHAAAESK